MLSALICMSEDIYADALCQPLLTYFKEKNIQTTLFFSVSKLPERLQTCEPLKQLLHYESRVLVDHYEFKQTAKAFNTPCHYIDKIDSEETRALVDTIQPDLILSIRFTKIFKEYIIKQPKFGLINLHGGILPEVRGLMPSFHALNNNHSLGFTFHFIDSATIDTGPIIQKVHFQQNKDLDMVSQLLIEYPKLLPSFYSILDRVLGKQTFPVSHQDEGNYYSYPNEEEIQSFVDKGHRLIDMDRYKDYVQAHYPNVSIESLT